MIGLRLKSGKIERKCRFDFVVSINFSKLDKQLKTYKMKNLLIKIALVVALLIGWALLICSLSSCSKGEEVLHTYEINVIGGYINSLTVSVGNHKINTTNYTGGGPNWRNNFGAYYPTYKLKIDTLAAQLKVFVSVTDGGSKQNEMVRIEIKKDGVIKVDTAFNYFAPFGERITIDKVF